MTYGELHALSTRSPQLAANDNLTALSSALHDEPQDTIASPPDRKTVKQFVPEGLALSDSR